MGNRLLRMTSKKESKETGSRSKRVGGRSQRKMLADEEFIHRQALSMALQQSQRFDGSMSRRIGSSTSRRHNLTESLSNAKEAERK